MEQFVGCISTYTYVWIRLTLTRGGGGWRPFLHLHMKWCFDDVLIFSCVPLSKNDLFFWNFELFSPKTYTLKGSVSELSHTAEIFWPPKCSESLNAAVRLHTSQCVSVSLHTSEYVWIRLNTFENVRICWNTIDDLGSCGHSKLIDRGHCHLAP